jgi:hypothetical protein
VVSIPPSPTVTTLRGCSEKHATSPAGSPTRRQDPPNCISDPRAQAASSTTFNPWARATAMIASMSQGVPIWCTQRMARVFGVMAAAISAASMP